MDKFLIIHEISQKSNRNKLVSASKLAEIFHNRIKESYNNDAEKFILELKKSAENYQKIKEIDFDPELNKIFRCLLCMPTEWIPTVLAFLNKLNNPNSKLGQNDFNKFILYFEKVYMHRWFAKKGKSYRDIVCYAVISDINNNSVTDFEGNSSGHFSSDLRTIVTGFKRLNPGRNLRGFTLPLCSNDLTADLIASTLIMKFM